MTKAIAILGIIAMAIAVLTTITSGEIVILLALFALGAGIYLCISKEWQRIAPGASAILFSILGIMGRLQSISTEDGGVDFFISPEVGHAFILIALLEICGASILLNWGQFEPEWLQWIFAAAWGIGFIMAFVSNGNLGAVNLETLGVLLPTLVMLASPILYLRET
ncbi:MAG: hypothetical protein ACPHK8_05185 [Thermoplasmatota archaeon]